MNKAEAVSNVCLVCINVDCECTRAVSYIENAFRTDGIDILFVSTVNIFGHSDKIYIAIAESDVFSLMNILGKIRNDTHIKNYSVNCSNSMIKWRGKVSPDIFEKAGCDIKLILSLSDEGICFCDNAYRERVCTLLTCRTPG